MAELVPDITNAKNFNFFLVAEKRTRRARIIETVTPVRAINISGTGKNGIL